MKDSLQYLIVESIYCNSTILAFNLYVRVFCVISTYIKMGGKTLLEVLAADSAKTKNYRYI